MTITKTLILELRNNDGDCIQRFKIFGHRAPGLQNNDSFHYDCQDLVFREHPEEDSFDSKTFMLTEEQLVTQMATTVCRKGDKIDG